MGDIVPIWYGYILKISILDTQKQLHFPHALRMRVLQWKDTRESVFLYTGLQKMETLSLLFADSWTSRLTRL